MFYVELRTKNGGYQLGNMEGQGFYRTNNIQNVVRVLESKKITSKAFLQDCVKYEIYRCNDSNKFSDNLPLVRTINILV